MKALPVELLSLILQAACLDDIDGSIARSLSLVSRHMQEVSKPFLYQSIVVTGPESIASFSQILEALPPHFRRVRHLFLSDWARKSARDNEANRPLTQEFTMLLRRIIDYAAPTLETMAFFVLRPSDGPPLIRHLFSTTFPRLTHLAVHGAYPFPHQPNSMPRLTYLHLSGNRVPRGLLESGGLSAACPSLTSLEVVGISGVAVTFASEVRRVLQARVPSGDLPAPTSTSSPSRLPPPIRYFLVFHLPRPRVKPVLDLSIRIRHTYRQMEAYLGTPDAAELRLEVVESPLAKDMFKSILRRWEESRSKFSQCQY